MQHDCWMSEILKENFPFILNTFTKITIIEFVFNNKVDSKSPKENKNILHTSQYS